MEMFRHIDRQGRFTAGRRTGNDQRIAPFVFLQLFVIVD